MKIVSRLMVLGLFFGFLLFFSCRRPEDYDDEAQAALREIFETQEDADSSEVQIQLAQLPEPDGIPILVGIDKAPFWVKDPSDPTPLIHMVNLYTNIYVRSISDFGEYLFNGSRWERVGDSFPGVSLRWCVGTDTFNLILRVYTYDRDNQGRLHVTSGKLSFIKKFPNPSYGLITDTLYDSLFEIQEADYFMELYYVLKGIVKAIVIPTKIQSFAPFVGTISAYIVNSLGDTTAVVCEVNSSDTRHVVIDFRRFNIDFRIVADVSAKRVNSVPAYRLITGNFYANGKDIADISGVKYEFDTSEQKSYLNITLISGKVMRFWN